MRRTSSFVFAAALLALAVFISGTSEARPRSSLVSRLDRTDAQKAADLRADAERWLVEDDDRGYDHETHRLLREVAWRASAASLEADGGQNGGVIVTGWGKDSIRVVARVQAHAREAERARELAESVRIVSEDGRLSAEGADYGDDEGWAVTFDVLVPRNKELHLSAHNGPVAVTDMDSRMQLETVNGPMALRAVAGDVHARTQNGPLSVRLTGARWRGAGLDASTQNGPVALRVPRGYSCMLETGTINGPMTVGIPIVVQGRIDVRHHHISTKLGGGGPLVRATTTNGPASVSYTADAGSEAGEVEN